MNFLRRIQCRLTSHRYVCSQIVTLIVDEYRAERDHTHECVRCGYVKIFPVENLDASMTDMLMSMVLPSKKDVRLPEDPPTYIH